MTDLALQVRSAATPSLATWRDYVALLKPRVMSLVVFTALAGLVVAPGAIHPVLGLTAILCVAVGSGASGAINMWCWGPSTPVTTSPPAASGSPPCTWR